jgi:cytochrome P450
MASAVTDGVSKGLFDPFDEDLIVAPGAHYRRLRLEDPVHWSPSLRAWLVTRMEDVRNVLNDRSFEALEGAKYISELARRAGRDYSSLIQVLDVTLFYKEGPAHQQTRRTISKIINRIPLSQLKSRIDDIATSLSTRLSNLSEYDAIEEFAEPLPHYVMAYILGLRESDIPTLNELLRQLSLTFDGCTLDVYDNINAKAGVALDLLQSRIAEVVNNDTESGLSGIYEGTSGSESDRLAQSAAIALFTYRVGSETTMSLIGFLIRALLERPWLRQMIHDNPAVAGTAVSEVIRLEGMVQRSLRVCRQARIIGNKTIQSGDCVMVLFASANRDPAAFAAPDDLNLEQTARPDVAFGEGRHYCPGASLTQFEGRVALEHLVKLPAIERAGDEKWYAGRTIRRLTHLPVRVVRNPGAGS